MSNSSIPVIAPTYPAKAVIAPVRLFNKQRGFLCLLSGFFISSLLLIILVWLAGPMEFLFWVGAIQFFLLPIAALFVFKSYFVKPALLSFTNQGFSLEANDKQYEVAWANLAAYKVEFSLDKLVGAGYRLKLRTAQGHSTVLNLLEEELFDPEGGFRADSALAYLCRYIGWYNKRAEGNAEQIVPLPTIFDRKIGILLMGVLGILIVVDFGLRVLHPIKTGATIGTFVISLVMAAQLLGQKKNNDRYKHFLQNLQDEGSNMQVS